jgi:hypothetical protein
MNATRRHGIGGFADLASLSTLKPLILNNILMVPPERIELPTFGLQNRCSTAELQGHARRLAYLARQ